MVKINKKSKSDNYARIRKQKLNTKSFSPFEIHINKTKQNVLGKKSKISTGLPGISRTKAITKRKKTLLLEYKVKDKDNIFLDRRIGEKNSGMSEEDKAMARFAAEQIKAHKKKNIFNLNDEELLTHRGQSLIDIEKYDNPKSDDDYSDEENKTGKLDKKFVGDAHFGGGILSKSNSEVSRKDLIDQLIFESKKRKAERQKIREQTIDLTEKLDSDWHDLIPLMSSSKKNKEIIEQKCKPDDYDVALQNLKYEARGIPTDKLKSEDAIALKEKIALEKLEAERLSRMHGFSDEAEFQRKHRSADELDNFQIEKIEDEPLDNVSDDDKMKLLKSCNAEIMAKQNEINTKMNNLDEKNYNNKVETKDNKEIDDVNEDNESDNLSDFKFESSDIDDKSDNLSDLKAESSDTNDESDNLSDLKAESSDTNDESDNLSDLKTESLNTVNESESIRNKNIKNIKFKEADNNLHKNTQSITKHNTKTIDNSTKSVDALKVNVNTNIREAIDNEARQELSDFTVPATYEKLLSLIKNYNPDYQSIIIERIIKYNQSKSNSEHKEKLSNLFSFLLQYLNDCASTNTLEGLTKFFLIFDKLCPHLYDLTHLNPESTRIYLHDVLKEKHSKFEKKIKIYPKLDTLFLFKLVSILYPTSDFRHPIVTPCLVFMSQILLRCKVRRKEDITRGLFLCTVILEYTVLNKKWSPSVINFLRGVIFISLPKPFLKPIKVISPFKTMDKSSNLLVLEANKKNLEINLSSIRMQIEDFCSKEIDDNYRLRTFITTINLLQEFKEQCKELDACYFIFEPILTLLKCGSVKRYPKVVKEKLENLIGDWETLKYKKLKYLVFDKKRPKTLRVYEPRIEVVYDGKKHKPMSKAKAEREKLLYKLKKETKSAIREVRKDNAFLSKVKIKREIANDIERKRKVKEIFGDAAVQQSELKKLKK